MPLHGAVMPLRVRASVGSCVCPALLGEERSVSVSASALYLSRHRGASLRDCG